MPLEALARVRAEAAFHERRELFVDRARPHD
jgi:hypothetical protein